MHYTIISASPQNKTRSTSALIASVAKDVLTRESENTASVYYINERNKWNEIMDEFYGAENIIFVLPLYVEGIPGILLEFLQSLESSKKRNGKISFILQGGFEEASQLRTAEQYLIKIPVFFNCQYGGTLLKGGMFGIATLRGSKVREKACMEYEKVLEEFKKKNVFKKEDVVRFAGIEYYSKGMIFLSNVLHPLNILVWNVIGKKYGIKGTINQRPYDI